MNKVIQRKPLMTSDHLTFCIINYNGENYLEETIRSVLKQKHAQDEIILIDNASVDRSLSIVKEKFSGVKIVQLKKNLGPGAARNAGFKCSLNDLIVFLDNDVCLTNNSIRQLIAEFEKRPKVAAAMPCVLYADRPNIIQYDGADMHYLGLMILRNANHNLGKLKNCEPQKTGSIVTACFFMDRKRWELGKPFDEDFFMYFEDHDFGLKIRTHGYDILSVPAATVLHREGTPGLSLRKHGQYAPLRVFNNIRNRWQIILKFFSLRSLFILFPILAIYEAFQFAVALKKGWMREWFSALFWIMNNANRICNKRLQVQRNRKISDREIFRNGPLPFAPEFAQTRLEERAIKFLNGISMTYWKYAKHLL